MSYQEDHLKAIADAIREKDHTTAPILPVDFPDRIRAIKTGIETDDATATEAKILLNETAYVKGAKITGNIPSVAGRIITPISTQQTAISAHNYASGDIIVAGDANLISDNIKSGVSIFGVSGNLSTLDYAKSINLSIEVIGITSYFYICYNKGSSTFVTTGFSGATTQNYTVYSGPMSIVFVTFNSDKQEKYNINVGNSAGFITFPSNVSTMARQTSHGWIMTGHIPCLVRPNSDMASTMTIRVSGV